MTVVDPERCRPAGEHIGLPIVGKYRGGVVGGDDARVALLAILPAPVGIIAVASCETYRLIDGGSLLTSTDRRAKGDQTECLTPLIPLVLCSESIGEIFIKSALHYPLMGIPTTEESGKSPATVHKAGIVAYHRPGVIIAVGPGECELSPSAVA